MCSYSGLGVQFLWSQVHVTGGTLAAIAPFAVMSAVFAQVTAVRWLAGLALAAACTHYLAMRHVRRQGQKFI